MGLSGVASISNSFNANLAPKMSMPFEQATPGAAVTLAQDSGREAPALAGQIERIESALNNGAQAGGAISGAVGFERFAAAQAGGMQAGGNIIPAANAPARAMSAPQEQERSQFASYADIKRGQDIMDHENEMMLSGATPYLDAERGMSVGGFVVNQGNPYLGQGFFDTKPGVLSGRDRKEMEMAHGSMLQQLDGHFEQVNAAQKFAQQEGSGGVPGGIKMSGSVASGWTTPPPGFGI